MRFPCLLTESLRASHGRLPETVHRIAEALGHAVDAKDKRLSEHSSLTADLAGALAQAHGLSDGQAGIVHIAGHLHDIGKIAVPDRVLRNPSSLNEAEWTLMRDHPRVGAEMLKPIEVFSVPNGVAEMVLSHHERFDGEGYPRGLSGRDIPLGGRILAVADSVAAMLEDRVYRPALSFDQAMEEIERGASTRYDPDVCRDFIANVRDMVAMLTRRRADGQNPPVGIAGAVIPGA